jgi:hypothetical protein
MAFVRVCLMDVPMPTFQNRIEEPNKTFSPTTMPGQVQIATQQPMIRPTETPTDQPTVAVMPTEFPSAIPVQIPFDDMPTKTPYDPNAVMQTGAAPTIQSPPSFYTEAPLTNEPVINIPHIEIPSVDASEESTFAKHSQHPNYLVSHVEETVAFPSSKTFSIIEEPPNVPLVQDIFENSIPLFVAPEINSSVVNAPVVSEPPLDASGETIPLVEENYLHPIVTFSPFLKKKETAQFSQSVNPESYTFLPSSSQVAPFWAIDRDHSGLITKDEWTFYSQHLAKNALQIINQTKDPIAKKLLFSQVKYHYPRLNKCIHTKLINVSLFIFLVT